MRRAVGEGRERVDCPDCGKNVLVRRDGGLIAHSTPDRMPCRPAAWQERHAAQRAAAAAPRTAEGRDEHEPCQTGTIGCSVDHVAGSDEGCATW